MDERLHVEVRAMAISWLQKNPETYSSFVPEDYDEYITRMRKDSTWGDHVVLQAVADYFGAEICVLSSFPEEPVLRITPASTKTERTLWLSFWAEVRVEQCFFFQN